MLYEPILVQRLNKEKCNELLSLLENEIKEYTNYRRSATTKMRLHNMLEVRIT